MVYRLRDLVEWSVSTNIRSNLWVPPRPLPGPWTWRLWDAWEVLQGRADAFVWPSAEDPQQSDGEEPSDHAE